ncbi:hypothetical protein IJ556_07135 [bacterium]|nr:hypothetical protein [bacterium]
MLLGIGAFALTAFLVENLMLKKHQKQYAKLSDDDLLLLAMELDEDIIGKGWAWNKCILYQAAEAEIKKRGLKKL